MQEHRDVAVVITDMLLLPPSNMLTTPVVNILAFHERHMPAKQIDNSTGLSSHPAIDFAGLVIERFHPASP